MAPKLGGSGRSNKMWKAVNPPVFDTFGYPTLETRSRNRQLFRGVAKAVEARLRPEIWKMKLTTVATAVVQLHGVVPPCSKDLGSMLELCAHARGCPKSYHAELDQLGEWLVFGVVEEAPPDGSSTENKAHVLLEREGEQPVARPTEAQPSSSPRPPTPPAPLSPPLPPKKDETDIIAQALCEIGRRVDVCGAAEQQSPRPQVAVI